MPRNSPMCQLSTRVSDRGNLRAWTVGRLLARLIAAIAVCCAAAGHASSASGSDELAEQKASAAAPERAYPSLPGAIREVPEWLKQDAPFDVDEFFVLVPPEENAATLYLEALYEFATRDMVNCISPAEHEERGAALLEREERTFGLMVNGGDAAVRAAVLKEYDEAFAKIARAQQRNRCVFEIGCSLNAMFHHAQAARAVARLLNWRVEFALAEKDTHAALDNIEMGLRLARDLRPRGSVICQLVGIALDAMIVQGPIYGVLASPHLQIGDCDRLLKMLAAHRPGAVEPAVEGLRAEYIAYRDLLHRLERKERLGDLVGAPASSNGVVVASSFDVRGDRSTKVAEQIDERLAEMDAADFAAEVDALNRYFVPLIKPGDRPWREFDEPLPEQKEAAADMTLLSCLGETLFPPQFIEALRRDRTRMGAIACVVALRRWQIAEPDRQPADLLAACRAAGMKEVPTDEYSRTREPLRWIQRDGGTIVYSVARDGNDDKAERDWNFGQNPGDFVFRLPLMLPAE